MEHEFVIIDTGLSINPGNERLNLCVCSTAKTKPFFLKDGATEAHCPACQISHPVVEAMKATEDDLFYAFGRSDFLLTVDIFTVVRAQLASTRAQLADSEQGEMRLATRLAAAGLCEPQA